MGYSPWRCKELDTTKWLSTAHSYRNNVLICYLHFAHKNLFSLNKIEILFICSNKVEKNTSVLFILNTSFWGKARWGGWWSHLWDSEGGSREPLQVRSFITSNFTTKYVVFLILALPTIKAISIYLGVTELFCPITVVVALVLFVNRIREREEKAVGDEEKILAGQLASGGGGEGRRWFRLVVEERRWLK